MFQFCHFHANGMQCGQIFTVFVFIILNRPFKMEAYSFKNLFSCCYIVFVFNSSPHRSVPFRVGEMNFHLNQPHRAQRKWYGQVINPFTVGKSMENKSQFSSGTNANSLRSENFSESQVRFAPFFECECESTKPVDNNCVYMTLPPPPPPSFQSIAYKIH